MTHAEMTAIIDTQRNFFKSGVTLSLDFRIGMLKEMKVAILEYEHEIYDALKKDLGKHEFESFGGEVGLILLEINNAIKKLARWMKPEKVPTPLLHFPGKSFIYSEPFGNALLIAPWNYPFQLLMSPLVGSICGGNTSILKPSSTSANTSSVIKKMIDAHFDPSYICVMETGRSEGNFLLEQKFDIIFYTGSTEAGKTVMAAAAKNLTPVILELGGKSPCIVDRTANIPVTARRIVWGKFFNSGQTCIAPDYVYADASIKKDLINKMKKVLIEFYGTDPKTSDSYGRIINKKQIDTLTELMKNETVVHGGEVDPDALYFSPTIVEITGFDSPLMSREIFGPIMPIMEYTDINTVIEQITSRSKPLTLYIFSKNRKFYNNIIEKTSSGSVCVNDTLSQFTSKHLPFGGVGDSGMGKYHGKSSFNAFTHKKSVMKKSFLVEIMLRYPPYRKLTGTIKKLIGIFG
jgi:aldehyde dehydrogenase (NAD+)